MYVRESERVCTHMYVKVNVYVTHMYVKVNVYVTHMYVKVNVYVTHMYVKVNVYVHIWHKNKAHVRVLGNTIIASLHVYLQGGGSCRSLLSGV